VHSSVVPTLATLVVLSCRSVPVTTPDLARVNDGHTWNVINTDPIVTNESGRTVVRLYPRGGDGPGSNVALALVRGDDFQEGTIDVDLRGRAGELRSFLGVAFNVTDEKTFEAVYFRPFNFRAPEPEHRVRAVQYVAWPDHPWEELRTWAPDTNEAAIQPPPEPGAWFHARIEVTRETARVYVDGATTPCLGVRRLRPPESGGVGLFVDSHEGWFANLRITHARAGG
jgi:hypothetical protein